MDVDVFGCRPLGPSAMHEAPDTLTSQSHDNRNWASKERMITLDGLLVELIHRATQMETSERHTHSPDRIIFHDHDGRDPADTPNKYKRFLQEAMRHSIKDFGASSVKAPRRRGVTTSTRTRRTQQGS